MDVLVVGAGGAGLRAAIEAERSGAKATMVCKGGFPSGCTPLAMGAMQAVYDPRDTPDIHFKDTIIGGRLINDQILVRKLVDQATKLAQELEEFGTVFQKEDGKYKPFTFGGYSYPRAIVASETYAGGFVRGLVNKVLELKIEVIEKTVITRLLTQNDTVVGATGFNLETGDFVVLKAKSVVLATGGAGCLYPLTTNPQDVTGDGYAMAYRIGAELMDMEFIQTRACILHPPTLRGRPPPADGLGTVGGRFYNGRGERYMKKYEPAKGEKVTRDLISIFTYKEIKEGRGTPNGGVYNDLSGVPEGELKRFQSFLKACSAAGIDPTWQPLEWAPGVHHFMGGVRINEEAETTINGLFACGEVAAGVHGANRMAANALTDVLVFGATAGKFAAQKAITKTSPKIDEKQIKLEKERIFNIYERDEGEDFKQIRTKTQNIMNNSVGVIRREDELRRAMTELERINTHHLYIAGKKNYRELNKLLETINFIQTGKLIAQAALMRTESRGAHYREDFPKENNEKWLSNIIIRLQNGKLTLETKPVILSKLRPPQNFGSLNKEKI